MRIETSYHQQDIPGKNDAIVIGSGIGGLHISPATEANVFSCSSATTLPVDSRTRSPVRRYIPSSALGP